jgi:hypothetical protein
MRWFVLLCGLVAVGHAEPAFTEGVAPSARPSVIQSSCVRVTAIAVSGAESTPESCTGSAPVDVIPVTLLSSPPDAPATSAVIGFALALVIGVFLVFAPEIELGWLRRREQGNMLLPAAAEQLARDMCRTAITRGALVIALASAAIAVVTPLATSFVLLAAVLLLARQLWVITRARRMLQLLDVDSTVTLHGDHVVRVRTHGDTSWLVCSPRQLAAATEHVLPLARVL